VTERNRIIEPPGCGLDAAPYVLGALEPHEVSAFVRHMERCAVCRDEVASLALVIDALPAAVPPRPVRAVLRRRVLRAVRDEATGGRTSSTVALRRSAPVGWLALAAAAMAALVVQLGANHPRERVIPASVGHAELRVSNGHGELVAEHLAALPADRTYELWIQSGQQAPAPSTLFAVSTDGGADIGVPGDLQGISRVLVTVEPRGGSLAPTTRAVIQVPVSYVRRS
jgi:anti-sigma-K factor RskA